jgi:hypothetical protein
MPRDPVLRDVQKRAKAYERARNQLWTAIRTAHERGHSLRVIAAAAGLSHEQVRRIIRTPVR